MSSFTNLSGFTIPGADDLTKYPALSVGLSIFTFILLILDSVFGQLLSEQFSLNADALFKFDLNRLSLYLLFHTGLVHWLFNVLALFSVLVTFERTHGTIHTGITLNLLAVSAGIQYCVVSKVVGSHSHVIGLSGVVFLFLSYVAYKEHPHRPVLHTVQYRGTQISIPTLFAPILLLFVTVILVPGSSFLGHLAGISSGYLLAKNYLKVLYPPLRILVFIEDKLAGAILLLNGIVVYYKEEDAVNLRGVSYNPIFSADNEANPAQTSTA